MSVWSPKETIPKQTEHCTSNSLSIFSSQVHCTNSGHDSGDFKTVILMVHLVNYACQAALPLCLEIKCDDFPVFASLSMQTYSNKTLIVGEGERDLWNSPVD